MTEDLKHAARDAISIVQGLNANNVDNELLRAVTDLKEYVYGIMSDCY